jgi:hypothetical protein
LGISQAKELVKRGKPLDPIFSTIPANTDIEFMSRKILKQLPEDSLTRVHCYPPEKSGR